MYIHGGFSTSMLVYPAFVGFQFSLWLVTKAVLLGEVHDDPAACLDGRWDVSRWNLKPHATSF